MDRKSIVLNKRMKFFLNITLISSCLSLNLAYPCDVPNTPEPSHQLFFLCSMPHSPQPKSDDPNTFCPVQEILVAKALTSGLSTSLPIHLCSMTEDIQHACEHGLCSLRLSKYDILRITYLDQQITKSMLKVAL